MKKLSILIPVYNPGEYFRTTLSTFLSLAPREDIEIIVGDDGSSDTSLISSLRDLYEPKGVRFVSFPHGGLALTRRRLFKEASGEYTLFCDDDDYYHPDAIDYLIGLAEAHKAPMVTAAFTTDPEKLSITGSTYILEGKETALRCLHQTHTIHNSGWAQLFRSDFLRKFVDLMPDGKLYEDLAMVPRAMAAAPKVVVTEAPLYFYRIRKGSLINTLSPARGDVLEITTGLMNYFSTVDKTLFAAACDRAFSAACNIGILFSNATNIDAKTKQEILSEAKKLRRTTRRYSLLSPGVRLKNRLGALLPFPLLLAASRFTQKYR